MAAQYDRATPEEGNVTQRHGLLPLATYDNGRTGLAFPGFVADPLESWGRLLKNGYQGGTGDTQGVEDAFNVAGAAMLGGFAAPKPAGVVGSAGGSLKAFPDGIKREWAPGGERVEIYTPETKPYPMGGNKFPDRTGFTDEPLAPAFDLKPRSDGSGEWVWPFTEADEALTKRYGSRAAPDLYANGGRSGAATGAALGAIPDTPGIRAYHGSPHDFDRFDLSKIGTGEGAQAYGHGLYFAENEGVAKSYREGLTQVEGYQGTAADLIRHHNGDRVAALDEAKRGIDKYAQTDPYASKEWQKVAGVLEDQNYSGPGRMYEVNIKANPDDFLDWDKPLSQQSEKVRALYDAEMRQKLKQRQIGDNPNLGPLTDVMVDGGGSLGVFTKDNLSDVLANPSKYAPTTGADFLDDIARRSVNGDWGAPGDFARQQATQRLREAGIPGIRYLDQGSRAGGDGSRNLVVFDDKLIEILRKYGLLGMAGGAAAAEYGFGAPQPSPASPKYRPGDA